MHTVPQHCRPEPHLLSQQQALRHDPLQLGGQERPLSASLHRPTAPRKSATGPTTIRSSRLLRPSSIGSARPLAWTRRRWLPSTPLPPPTPRAAATPSPHGRHRGHGGGPRRASGRAASGKCGHHCRNSVTARLRYPVHHQYARVGQKATGQSSRRTTSWPAPSWIWTRPRRRMLARHRAVAKEYTTDALKIQQQMEDLIAERDFKASPAVPTQLCRETTV
jgi:hypothetical protein